MSSSAPARFLSTADSPLLTRAAAAAEALGELLSTFDAAALFDPVGVAVLEKLVARLYSLALAPDPALADAVGDDAVEAADALLADAEADALAVAVA